MQMHDFIFTDTTHKRTIPVCVYLPDDISAPLPIVIFNPGYQCQQDLAAPNAQMGYKKYNYLATFFTERHYAFISIQHDMLGDNDSLETIDPTAPQHEAREHIYKRGVDNIFCVINELQQKFSYLTWQKFIIAGHSNGGDIAKYFANLYSDRITCVIAMDARRCRIEPNSNLRLLMFEANDTSTDPGVIPDQGTEDNPKRNNLEWTIVKPRNALHISYNGSYITPDIQQSVFSAIDWFLH